MISAVLLVMIVVISTMGLRAAGLVGVAIPSAFLSGVLILFMMGLTVNIVVLFGLILSVGMLVDGAIVVTELADRNIGDGELINNFLIILNPNRKVWIFKIH